MPRLHPSIRVASNLVASSIYRRQTRAGSDISSPGSSFGYKKSLSSVNEGAIPTGNGLGQKHVEGYEKTYRPSSLWIDKFDPLSHLRYFWPLE